MVWSFSQRPSSRWVAQYGGMKANERSAVTVLCERFGISERRALCGGGPASVHDAPRAAAVSMARWKYPLVAR